MPTGLRKACRAGDALSSHAKPGVVFGGPAVSGRISQIEARFAVRLLDRNANCPAVPTPKGMELYAYAERMQALRADLEATLAGRTNLSGIVRIGVAEALQQIRLSGHVICPYEFSV